MLRKSTVLLAVMVLQASLIPTALAMETTASVDTEVAEVTSTAPFSEPVLTEEASDGFAPVDTVEPLPQPEPDPWVENAEPEPALDVEVGAATEEAPVSDVSFQEFTIDPSVEAQINDFFISDLMSRYPEHSWAPLGDFELEDWMLEAMGLPSSDVLKSHTYEQPTMINRNGDTEIVDIDPVDAETGTLGPTAPPFAGAGWFGIRPGAKVLLLSGGGVGWCTLAHVYGSPGSYSISTAGHCGKTGDTATLIAAFGNRSGVLNPVLLDIGTFKTSHDGGLGNDWALIGINSEWQNLATPTMCLWGGPRGMYTKTGALVGITFPRRGFVPSVTLNPDPLLAQTIVHYGHGTGIGAGGTGRAGLALHWGASHFMFEGAISFGDSGSGSNAIVGDTIGGSMEAAGINTHIWIDPLMRDGIGIMGGTRATSVSGTLANGQLVAYPVPVPPAP